MIELSGVKGVSAWLVYNKVVFNLIFIRRFNVEHIDQLSTLLELDDCETVEEFETVREKIKLDQYKKVIYPLSEVLETFKAQSDEVREAWLLEAINYSDLTDPEIIRLLSVHSDPNGIAYTKANIANLKVTDIIPLSLKTLVACSKLDCDLSLMSKEEIDILGNRRIDIKTEANEVLSNAPDIKTGELLALSIKRVISRFRA